MKILILDDDQDFKREVFDSWSTPDTEIMESTSDSSAIKLLTQGGFGALFLSTNYLTLENLDTIDLAKEHNPGIEIFVLTTAESTRLAEQAVNRGAHSYLVKPVNIKLLEAQAAKVLSRSLSRANYRALEEQLLEELLGSTPAMKKIHRLVSKVAKTNSSILISGESGTGKEFLANIIHRLSDRSEEDFVAINCGAIPENLIEAELFGSRKGSYTGSVADRKGLFEEADKGTLLLDEVGELALTAQVKLLRFLQEKELRRVGDTESRFVNVRVIAATNRDLYKAIERGVFREDLFYRLSVFHIHIPPLRERKEAIPRLIRNFVKKYSQGTRKGITGIAKNAESVLMAHNYPGNIRELENIIEHAMALCEGENILLEDLPEYLVQVEANRPYLALPPSNTLSSLASIPASESSEIMTLAEMEKLHISQALRSLKKNHTEVAKKLGISRSSLWRKIKEYQIEV